MYRAELTLRLAGCNTVELKKNIHSHRYWKLLKCFRQYYESSSIVFWIRAIFFYSYRFWFRISKTAISEVSTHLNSLCYHFTVSKEHNISLKTRFISSNHFWRFNPTWNRKNHSSMFECHDNQVSWQMLRTNWTCSSNCSPHLVIVACFPLGVSI